jgi:hypothetical protein
MENKSFKIWYNRNLQTNVLTLKDENGNTKTFYENYQKIDKWTKQFKPIWKHTDIQYLKFILLSLEYTQEYTDMQKDLMTMTACKSFL